MPAPTARHRFDGLGNHFGLFNIEVPTHGVVVKGTNGRRLHNIKAGYVAAGRASISGGHALNGTGLEVDLNHATEVLGVFAD